MRRRQRGFTLLEVVIAVAIFALMFVLAQMAFHESLNNRDDIRCMIIAAAWCGDVVRNMPVLCGQQPCLYAHNGAPNRANL